MFRCVADGYPKPQYRWYDSSRKPVDSTESKYGISPSGEYLTVYELVEADVGEFSCEASNQAGRTETRARLTVIVPPGLNEGQRETRELGQEVMFVCHVLRGDGQLSWWRNGRHVEEANEVNQFQLHNHQLWSIIIMTGWLTTVNDCNESLQVLRSLNQMLHFTVAFYSTFSADIV